MSYEATKIVIITEKMLVEKIANVIESAGASGYTILAAGGKGSRGVRSAGRATVVDDFSNVKIEVITAKRETAIAIADQVAARFFEDYPGITYLEPVEVLRPSKF
jgi:nitrogen regulatory protein PII